jgi:hypothetical protein
MRQTAVSHPPRSSVPPRFEDALAHEESPRESLTRLIASPQVLGESGSVAHTRPTTPVPTDYLFLNQRGLEDGTGILAGRLADLADEGDEGDDGHDVTEDVWSAAFDEITQTRTRTVVPDGEEVDASPRSMGMFSLLASVALVPYLRRAPRDIPRGTIDHAQACVLALIDGRTSIEQILDTSPMPVPRVLRVLSHLLDAGVVGLRG